VFEHPETAKASKKKKTKLFGHLAASTSSSLLFQVRKTEENAFCKRNFGRNSASSRQSEPWHAGAEPWTELMDSYPRKELATILTLGFGFILLLPSRCLLKRAALSVLLVGLGSRMGSWQQLGRAMVSFRVHCLEAQIEQTAVLQPGPPSGPVIFYGPPGFSYGT